LAAPIVIHVHKIGSFGASVGSSDRCKQIVKKGRKGLEEVRAILSRRLDQFWNVLSFTAREKKYWNNKRIYQIALMLHSGSVLV
jgi:hypothetical protein